MKQSSNRRQAAEVRVEESKSFNSFTIDLKGYLYNDTGYLRIALYAQMAFVCLCFGTASDTLQKLNKPKQLQLAVSLQLHLPLPILSRVCLSRHQFILAFIVWQVQLLVSFYREFVPSALLLLHFAATWALFASFFRSLLPSPLPPIQRTVQFSVVVFISAAPAATKLCK